MYEPRPGRYAIDPARSTVAFRTRHLFGLGPVRGSFPVRGGVVEVGVGLAATAVRAELDAAGFSTGNGARDGVVCSPKYLDVARHPLIVFAADGVIDGALVGELTVRDVTRPVRPRLERIEADGAGFTATADIRIDRREFGLTAQPGMTGRHLDLTITVAAVPT